ncbi:glycosyltransferase family 2 protein [Flammeovirgaceae bacterium SG7u.111]|nr:glycosyltransferase family 2 protein [Flammeovirgaceae bacterium SG7u.132]WPO38176.1 glycosyltransferase family 2 protein [Flammeovirgaceae bacterium SG7u.111]
MTDTSRIFVIIPAYNEEQSIAHVLNEIPKELVEEIIVVNNASTDSTAKVAKEAGATVLDEPTPGYGNACLKGIAYAKEKLPADASSIIVFMDGDHSDYPEQLPLLVDPIKHDGAEMVIGSRPLGQRESGSMTPQQIFGNWLATSLLKLFYGVTFTDLGPFRAIRFDKLLEIGMKDKTYGWTVEMQVKAAKKKLVCREVAVNYRKRIGVSKVSGTVKGTIMAGYKILFTIFRYL